MTVDNIAAVTAVTVATILCLTYLASTGSSRAYNPRKEWWTRENTARTDASMGAVIGVPLLLWPCAFFAVFMAMEGVLTLVARGAHAL